MKNQYFSYAILILLITGCQAEHDVKEKPATAKEGSNFKFYSMEVVRATQIHLSKLLLMLIWMNLPVILI